MSTGGCMDVVGSAVGSLSTCMKVQTIDLHDAGAASGGGAANSRDADGPQGGARRSQPKKRSKKVEKDVAMCPICLESEGDLRERGIRLVNPHKGSEHVGSHRVCKACIARIMAHASSNEEQRLRCPMCRQNMSVKPPYTQREADRILDAVKSDSAQSVLALLERRPVLHTVQDHEGKTPLHHAALSRRPACVRVLLDRGADPNATDNDGNTPLLYSAEPVERFVRMRSGSTRFRTAWTDMQSCKLLLEAGAKADAKGQDNITALMFVCRASGASAAKALQPLSDSDRLARDRASLERNALAECMIGDAVKLARLLVAHGADVNAQTTRGESALSYAAGVCDTVSDPPCRRSLERWCSALWRANTEDPSANRQWGDDLVRLLLDSGADANTVNQYLQTPLCVAAHCGHGETVRSLLDAGADPNAADENGNTPLMYAAGTKEGLGNLPHDGRADKDAQSELLVRTLLAAGADPSLRDKRGRTAADLACRRGRRKAARLLRAAIKAQHSGGMPLSGDAILGAVDQGVAEGCGLGALGRMAKGVLIRRR